MTICADGTVLSPTIIYKGKNFMRKWGDNNVVNVLYVLTLELNDLSLTLNKGSATLQMDGPMVNSAWHG